MTTATARRKRRPQPGLVPDLAPQEELTIRVDRVTFYAPDSGYTVMRGTVGRDDVATVGHVGGRPREGETYKLTGAWVEHPKFGRQWKFSACEIILPRDRDGIVAYLADAIAGIGPMRARQIVDALGDDALERIAADPTVLDSLAFLNDRQRSEIREKLSANRDLAELTALICRVPGSGVTPALAARIHAVHGNRSVEVVRENPYILSEDVWGVGFIRADAVARAIGVASNAPARVEAALSYIVRDAASEGHCYLRPRDIVPRAMDLLGEDSGVTIGDIQAANARLVAGGALVREEVSDGVSAIYTAALYGAETDLAERLRALAARPVGLDAEDLGRVVNGVVAAAGIELHPRQADAIRAALTSRLSVISGGPGTGKTTITRAIVQAYAAMHPDSESRYAREGNIHLASPTGRAAKRLSEATGLEAKTIHRLLEYHPETGFQRHERDPLTPGLLIVDEASMMDIELAASLFRAIPDDMRMVLVGDVDQLPSVGPGSVLRDIIDSGVVPVTRLEYVYRQAAGSDIHIWAHLIRAGTVPALTSGTDITVVEVADSAEAQIAVVRHAVEAERRYGRLGWSALAPMRRGDAGVTALNDAVRQAVNPEGDELRLGGTLFRLGDRVMVVRNNYALGVYNGDIGQVTNLIPASMPGGPLVTVDIAGGGCGRVSFDAETAGILTLAYASTIHKAQGGEYPCVIVVLTRQHYIMLQRNLLYTAITRARERLIVIHQPGEGRKPGAIERAVNNDQIAERYSRLGERLRA